MQNTERSIDRNTTAITCLSCHSAKASADPPTWTYFQCGLGLAGGHSHIECSKVTETRRLVDSFATVFGLQHSGTAHPDTFEGFPEAPRGTSRVDRFLDGAGAETLVVSRCHGDDLRYWLPYSVAQGLSTIPILNAPWLIDEEVALAMTAPSSALAARLRMSQPLNRCFACGYAIDAFDPQLSFASAGLGRSHLACLAVAREIGWQSFAAEWGLSPFGGYWCSHLVGLDPTTSPSQRHASSCQRASSGGHPAMDHARAWIVGPQSPWAGLFEPGSLLVTSEPYADRSLDATQIASVHGALMTAHVYPDAQLHRPKTGSGPGTELHVWMPSNRGQAA